jgi:hypothetical protein
MDLHPAKEAEGMGGVEIRGVYLRTLAVANFFVKNATAVGLTLDGLTGLDPSVQQFAHDMRVLSTIIKGLAGGSFEDENMAINAFQCCLIMERIAEAMEARREDQIESLVKDLERHIYVP